MWETIAAEAEAESPLWAGALRAPAERELEPVFSALADTRYALGLESRALDSDESLARFELSALHDSLRLSLSPELDLASLTLG